MTQSAEHLAEHRLSRGIVNGYADAARDHNSIHMSDEAAQSLGFDSAIAHGMLTLGWALSGAGIGNPAVKDAGAVPMFCSAKFVAPVAVGARLSLVGVGDKVRADPGIGEEPASSYSVLDESGTVVLGVRIDQPSARGQHIADLLSILAGAEIVAEVVVRADESAAVEFARALGTPDGPHTSAKSAHHAGFTGIPTVPTLAFALPTIGFLSDNPENSGRSRPDPVNDCQKWARTDEPVVHAGQKFAFARPILVGETMRAKTAIVARRERKGSGGRRLSFTDVRTVYRSLGGEAVAASEMGLVVLG